ncbi:hypothetical protein BJ508DRAFT_142721 [Ascobolus immersus RN42]|uniref:Uncharacterized protein n=1 Tax=Ascobolus immersus RN42 TaxID=1160509 RepID=A0A3N4I1F8_ASCIM|nr:hypothetical protein BJ508DRAFT_142721 [Ascobolus immersus RN42]
MPVSYFEEIVSIAQFSASNLDFRRGGWKASLFVLLWRFLLTVLRSDGPISSRTTESYSKDRPKYKVMQSFGFALPELRAPRSWCYYALGRDHRVPSVVTSSMPSNIMTMGPFRSSLARFAEKGLRKKIAQEGWPVLDTQCRAEASKSCFSTLKQCLLHRLSQLLSRVCLQMGASYIDPDAPIRRQKAFSAERLARNVAGSSTSSVSCQKF